MHYPLSYKDEDIFKRCFCFLFRSSLVDNERDITDPMPKGYQWEIPVGANNERDITRRLQWV